MEASEALLQLIFGEGQWAILLFKRFNHWQPKYALKLTRTSNSSLCQKMVLLISCTSSTQHTMTRLLPRLRMLVIINLDISNTFGTLCARLVLDVLAGKVSRDYACGINADADFETAVYELKAYCGFFRLQRACETILHFYSYDGTTNYVRFRTEGLQGD